MGFAPCSHRIPPLDTLPKRFAGDGFLGDRSLGHGTKPCGAGNLLPPVHSCTFHPGDPTALYAPHHNPRASVSGGAAEWPGAAVCPYHLARRRRGGAGGNGVVAAQPKHPDPYRAPPQVTCCRPGERKGLVDPCWIICSKRRDQGDQTVYLDLHGRSL